MRSKRTITSPSADSSAECLVVSPVGKLRRRKHQPLFTHRRQNSRMVPDHETFSDQQNQEPFPSKRPEDHWSCTAFAVHCGAAGHLLCCTEISLSAPFLGKTLLFTTVAIPWNRTRAAPLQLYY